jgi:predicted TIM-barrel fold metal-dependent hydrolase
MIIDCHTHLFPPAMRERRSRYFTGEPSFEMIYSSPKAKLVGARELIEAMDTNGIDRSVVFGFPWHSAEHFRAHNDYILESVARFPDRLVGLCCLDPMSPVAEQEVARCLENGLRGVGELAFYGQGLDAQCIEAMAPIMALCRTYRWPLMLHVNEPIGHQYPGKAPLTLGQIHAFVTAFPENELILCHWGGGLFFYGLLKKQLPRDLARVYFDTAASPYLYQPAVYAIAAQIVGADKILLGSDYPLLPVTRYLAEIEGNPLSAADVADIIGLNAQRLFRL